MANLQFVWGKKGSRFNSLFIPALGRHGSLCYDTPLWHPGYESQCLQPLTALRIPELHVPATRLKGAGHAFHKGRLFIGQHMNIGNRTNAGLGSLDQTLVKCMCRDCVGVWSRVVMHYVTHTCPMSV